MKIRIQPYTETLAHAAAEFNRRLDRRLPGADAASTGATIRLPETPHLAMPAEAGDGGFYQEYFLACESDPAGASGVHGGYAHYHQIWSVQGRPVSVANCMRPISEGVIDPAYGAVGVQLIRDALRRQPLNFGLGLGGSPMEKVLRAMRWDIWPVPFFFKVVNGARFLKNLQPLRRNPAGAFLADLAAACGLGIAGARVASAITTRRTKRVPIGEEINRFSSDQDRLWEAAARAYPVLELRDSAVLNRLFADRPEFTRLKIAEGNRAAGWAVLDTITSNKARFGDMNVHSIMDCLALPEDADLVVQAAVRYLENREVDLIVSNQSHPGWQKALLNSGFLRGPSTFLFASAPALTELLRAADPLRQGMHFTRGGGDVPLPHSAAAETAHRTIGA